MGKRYEIFKNGSLLESFTSLPDLREKLEDILSEAIRREKNLEEAPFISLQESEDDEEGIEIYLHTDTYGELDEDLIDFLNENGFTDIDVLLPFKAWLDVEVRIDKKKWLQEEISKRNLLDPQKIKLTIIESYQDQLEEMGRETLSGIKGFPNNVSLFSEGIEWEMTYVQPKDISSIVSDGVEHIEDLALTVDEFLTGYFYDMLMEKYSEYLIINIDVYTDPEDWIKEYGDDEDSQKNLYCFPYNEYVVYKNEEGMFYFEVLDRTENILSVSTYRTNNEDFGNVETGKRELELKIDTEKDKYYNYQFVEIEGRRIYANEYYNPFEGG